MMASKKPFTFAVLVLLVMVAVTKLCPYRRDSIGGHNGCRPDPSSSINVTIRSIGDPVPVWNSVDTWKECHLIDVPDIPARAFVANATSSILNASKRDAEIVIQLICGAVGYHEMHGPTLFRQTRSCDIAWNATKDGDPSHFAGNEFIDSPVRFDNGTVVALIHTEYPGDRYNACHIASTAATLTDTPLQRTHRPQRRLQRRHFDPPGHLTYPTCWMVTIGLGISYDWGHTWQHITDPPHHLVAAVPYIYNESYLAYGWGDPSNVVYNRNDGYYYATVWNRNQVGVQPPGICVMRSNDLMNPKSWRAWNGSDFVVRFVDPYRAALQSSAYDPKAHVCTTLDIPGTTKWGCNMFGILWSHDLRLFIGTVGCFADPKKHDTFFFTMSADLIHWTPIKEMFNRTKDLPPDVAAMTTSFHYPTFLDPTAFWDHGNANFDSIGTKPYLFWTGTGHSPYRDGRHLWATPMEILRGR